MHRRIATTKLKKNSSGARQLTIPRLRGTTVKKVFKLSQGFKLNCQLRDGQRDV